MSAGDQLLTRTVIERDRPTRRRRLLGRIALVLGSILALAGFGWPLLAPAVPDQAQAAAPALALSLVPALLVLTALALDGAVASAKSVALLGVLAAIGTAVRVASAGVAGVEAVFILLVLAGRAFGARFGFLLGVLTIAASSLVWGGIGPWTPFQAFAAGWIGAGAGLLPRLGAARAGGAPPGRSGRLLELGMLAAYGAIAAYGFGLVMNLWFWPFAVGTGTGISYDGAAPLGDNLAAFGLYSLVTSTATWDTVRAVTTVVGVLVVGRPVLAALRRAKLR
ncbi:ECF transporter S component [Agromyces seonyuensis]|uniref:ECF transporter S component n=1 Tax=Agromyces seonyuensis TaxID=2662446 RepID=A0A6I4P4N6_9MICO|nr:ECF transporter S component [Agromyces seonyuensis]MWB98397.1 ECF transporter S component [Agromyces seonyuensis]